MHDFSNKQKDMNNTAIFNKKHHYRELLAIGIPVIIGQLGTIILGFADTLADRTS